MQFQSKSGVIGVNVADRATLQSRIRACFEAGEGFALATLNLDHLVKFDSDGAFADAYRSHEMVVADGNPIVWMSKLAADPVELMKIQDMNGLIYQDNTKG